MGDCDPRLAKAFLDVSAKHYPERLGKFFVVGAPGVFNMLWRAIRGMVDPNTKEKIMFLPYAAFLPRTALCWPRSCHCSWSRRRHCWLYRAAQLHIQACSGPAKHCLGL